MRYGTKHCANDRLPAEKLEQAITRRLWKVLEDHDLLDLAINETYERLSERAGNQTSERDAITRKLAETHAAMDRYFRAFENGTIPEDTCAPHSPRSASTPKRSKPGLPNSPRSPRTPSSLSASPAPIWTRCAASYGPRWSTALPPAPRPSYRP
jgi:hypothetical protein